jgi:hypothetical protein
MKSLLLVLVMALPSLTFAENVNTTGAVSFLSLAKKVSKYSSLNFYHYDIYNFEKKTLQTRDFAAGMTQTYFQTSYSYQYLPTVTLTVGHIFQQSNPFNEERQNENRIFEQVVFSQNIQALFLTHRFRFEERLVDSEGVTDFRTRLRYQFGARRALRGNSIDRGEFYLNTYNEFYFSTTGERNALFSDDWLFLGLGFATKAMGSFELGPLIQWSRINEEKDTRTHYAVQFGWIFRS